MRIDFFKYQGTGNDFVVIDDRSDSLQLETAQVQRMCDRRFGIGADGLMLLRREPGLDFRMMYFNSDGRESSLCGNGARCITAFAARLGVIGTEAKFMAVDGVHEAKILPDGRVALKMQDVKSMEVSADHFWMNTGSPHYVKLVSDVESIDVVGEGRRIRNSERFREEGTNVNFLEKRGDDLFVRTYERGVEDETFSCGTGVTASALAAAVKGMCARNSCVINTRGGALEVSFEKVLDSSFYNIWLRGPAEPVFTGTIEI